MQRHLFFKVNSDQSKMLHLLVSGISIRVLCLWVSDAGDRQNNTIGEEKASWAEIIAWNLVVTGGPYSVENSMKIRTSLDSSEKKL